MIKWIKPSGVELETNDSKETVAYCESLGWKRKGAKVDKDPEQPQGYSYMSASQIKSVFADKGLDYPGNKARAIEILEGLE